MKQKEIRSKILVLALSTFYVLIVILGIFTVFVPHANALEYNIIQLTEVSSLDLSINNNGYVVWAAAYEIFLYDGMTITQLTNNDVWDSHPLINNNGYVLWESYDGILLYDGMTVTNLNGGSDPQINNNGYVVWHKYDGYDSEIFLYDGMTITQLTNNDVDDYSPQIKDNRYVVWGMPKIFLAIPLGEPYILDSFTETFIGWSGGCGGGSGHGSFFGKLTDIANPDDIQFINMTVTGTGFSSCLYINIKAIEWDTMRPLGDLFENVIWDATGSVTIYRGEDPDFDKVANALVNGPLELSLSGLDPMSYM